MGWNWLTPLAFKLGSLPDFAGFRREAQVIRWSAMAFLPANDLVSTGILDLQNGRETIAALLVAVGAPKLRKLGMKLPTTLPSNPEHRLYDLLSLDGIDSAHSRYNALIRKLVSFQRAMECVKR